MLLYFNSKQLFRLDVNVSAAYCYNKVARVRMGIKIIPYVFKRSKVRCVPAARVYGGNQTLSIISFSAFSSAIHIRGNHVPRMYGTVVLLAAGVNIRYQRFISQIEAGYVVEEQRFGPRI